MENFFFVRCLFSLGADGSSNTRIEKINPVVITVFDIDANKTIQHAMIMVRLQLFSRLLEKEYSIPWDNCASFNVDNYNAW